jgi:hypothetical protein
MNFLNPQTPKELIIFFSVSANKGYGNPPNFEEKEDCDLTLSALTPIIE